ncbi:hypothetical protein ATANTOWER_011293 [Ataeniobius toweri]|uniref:HAT C-terminal dimerisation domain-containing protein n=1 Tax=Ataeniobius toweri TaxID=208326 RepID=A0ABU7BP32_9TELE|nr:hypothetical protein [Ataeniobius toweri]
MVNRTSWSFWGLLITRNLDIISFYRCVVNILSGFLKPCVFADALPSACFKLKQQTWYKELLVLSNMLPEVVLASVSMVSQSTAAYSAKKLRSFMESTKTKTLKPNNLIIFDPVRQI